jgi:hypothetical protein
MTALTGIEYISVPIRCIDTVHQYLRKVGRLGFEGIGLWMGSRNGTHFQVTQAVVPRQQHIRSYEGVCVTVDAEELHRLNVWLYENKLTLIGQVHSHPTEAYHSGTDDEFAVATAAGSISLVVPDFAVNPFDLLQCAAYRLQQSGYWKELSPNEVSHLIRIV